MTDIDNPVFKKMMESCPIPDTDGYVWVNMLVKYNLRSGRAEVIRSFTRPAKDSIIKSMTKTTKKKETVKIDNVDKGKALF